MYHFWTLAETSSVSVFKEATVNKFQIVFQKYYAMVTVVSKHYVDEKNRKYKKQINAFLKQIDFFLSIIVNYFLLLSDIVSFSRLNLVRCFSSDANTGG